MDQSTRARAGCNSQGAESDECSIVEKINTENNQSIYQSEFSSIELVLKNYDKLYNQKVVVGLVDDVNLVFSVSLNKEIEEIFYTIL